MKKLGLIGGVGPETTLKYYKEIEYGVMEKLRDNVLPRITIESLSCFRMIPLGAAQDYEGMTDYIMGAVSVLEKADCDFIALACITGHM
ncbi:MAG: aspartate/glutamate racemase family protein, partial [Clostridium sp.]|nr:aspartate/glutamate racemase family protein [Clostridium sp.]